MSDDLKPPIFDDQRNKLNLQNLLQRGFWDLSDDELTVVTHILGGESFVSGEELAKRYAPLLQLAFAEGASRAEERRAKRANSVALWAIGLSTFTAVVSAVIQLWSVRNSCK